MASLVTDQKTAKSAILDLFGANLDQPPLVVFITVENLVAIDAVVLII